MQLLPVNRLSRRRSVFEVGDTSINWAYPCVQQAIKHNQILSMGNHLTTIKEFIYHCFVQM